jgi:hypothetical protein
MDEDKATALKQDYAANTWLIHRLVDGVSDEESVWQLPFNANCLNWILGHIVAGRNLTLRLLGAAPLWNERVQARYETGAPPVTPADPGEPFARLVADLDASQQQIEAALERSTSAALARVVETERGTRPVVQHVLGRHWHETFHVGQLEILRAFIEARREKE